MKTKEVSPESITPSVASAVIGRLNITAVPNNAYIAFDICILLFIFNRYFYKKRKHSQTLKRLVSVFAHL